MAIKTKEDGSTYYYYYKKKRGRRKKRGPKKKIKKRGPKFADTWDFKIIQFDFHKQVSYVGKYHDLYEVEKKKKELISDNESIEFPVKFVNNNRNYGKLYEYLSEYVIMKRKGDSENDITLLRNEFGKLVPNVTTSDEWVVYDKIPHLKEETFWVYGYNPKTHRKTYNFIYETYIDNILQESDYLIQIYIYNNKVIFRYDGNEFEFVICKNISDAVRMYNMLEEKYKKIKRVFFTGFTKNKDDRAREIISMIHEKTGWEYKKIYKKSTNE